MNFSEKKNTASLVRGIIEPIVNGLGYELWDVEYVKEGADMYLRITIDRDGGIDIEDCEKVSREIDPVIDERCPIEDLGYLEVSSPGIERNLTRKEHFERFAGEKIEAKLFKSVDGKKSVIGVLEGADDEGILISEEGNSKKYQLSDISKVTTVFDWEKESKEKSEK